MRGLKNSSLTRVRPLLQALIAGDPKGESWIPKLLSLASNNQSLALELSQRPQVASAGSFQTRTFVDPILFKHGIPNIPLERCFEVSTPPPTEFLKWLVRNPARMKWPTDKHGNKRRFGEPTQTLREALFKNDRKVQRSALEQIEKFGGLGSLREWWAFEGFTSVDCLIETESLVLIVEGKRTEALSKSTQWFPQRNQLFRNIEAASELARGRRQFGVMLVVETRMELDLNTLSRASFPHLSEDERSALESHYLGTVTWRDVCAATGVEYAALPDGLDEVISHYGGGGLV